MAGKYPKRYIYTFTWLHTMPCKSFHTLELFNILWYNHKLLHYIVCGLMFAIHKHKSDIKHKSDNHSPRYWGNVLMVELVLWSAVTPSVRWVNVKKARGANRNWHAVETWRRLLLCFCYGAPDSVDLFDRARRRHATSSPKKGRCRIGRMRTDTPQGTR